eukprot:14942413-Heterocapsa_arctica.AAC.1
MHPKVRHGHLVLELVAEQLGEQAEHLHDGLVDQDPLLLQRVLQVAADADRQLLRDVALPQVAPEVPELLGQLLLAVEDLEGLLQGLDLLLAAADAALEADAGVEARRLELVEVGQRGVQLLLGALQ